MFEVKVQNCESELKIKKNTSLFKFKLDRCILEMHRCKQPRKEGLRSKKAWTGAWLVCTGACAHIWCKYNLIIFRIREYLFLVLRLIINRSCFINRKIRERERKQDVGNSIRFFRQHKCYTFREKLIRGFVYWYNFRVGQKIIVFILGSLNHWVYWPQDK
jgi:hypothetical protein